MNYKHFFLILVYLVILTTTVFAHDYWLHPENFHIQKNDALIVHLYVGHDFNPELERPLQKPITTKFQLLSKDKEIDLLNELPDQNLPLLNTKIDSEGLFLLTLERDFAQIEMENPKFLEYLKEEDITHETINDKMSQREKQRERYARCIKSLIKVGDGEDSDIYQKVLGQKIEIVLLQNPYALKTGESITAKILFDRKPLVNKVVMAQNKNPEGKITTLKTKTSQSGEVQFKLDEKGIWLIRLVHMLPLTDDKNFDWESFWSSYSFEINK